MTKANKTNLKRKLTLHGETLVRLDPAVLDEVNGGVDIPRLLTIKTCVACPPQ
jgi:hypothetical protein